MISWILRELDLWVGWVLVQSRDGRGSDDKERSLPPVTMETDASLMGRRGRGPEPGGSVTSGAWWALIGPLQRQMFALWIIQTRRMEGIRAGPAESKLLSGCGLHLSPEVQQNHRTVPMTSQQ